MRRSETVATTDGKRIFGVAGASPSGHNYCWRNQQQAGKPLRGGRTPLICLRRLQTRLQENVAVSIDYSDGCNPGQSYPGQNRAGLPFRTDLHIEISRLAGVESLHSNAIDSENHNLISRKTVTTELKRTLHPAARYEPVNGDAAGRVRHGRSSRGLDRCADVHGGRIRHIS